jgi:hypothetical protein
MREAQLRAADQGLVAILVVFGAVCLVGLAVFFAFWQDNKRQVRLDPPQAFAHTRKSIASLRSFAANLHA